MSGDNGGVRAPTVPRLLCSVLPPAGRVAFPELVPAPTVSPDSPDPLPPPARRGLILLAPMEGLLDHRLRAVLTRVGGVDRCVSEFIRITDQLLPERVFLRIVPELRSGSRTGAGVPVRPQLLGSDPACLADNAARLAGLAPEGIDLNFGCPARTVNHHRGGAILLDEPELVGRIVAAVRRAVPPSVPVSAKMRLGFQDGSRTLECALAIAEAGAQELVVHARTRADGYRPPAYWDRIAAVVEAVALPVVAHREIWSVADALRCRRESGCHNLMLGRGLVADPALALALRAHDTGGLSESLSWHDLLDLMADYWQRVAVGVEARHRPGRLKQWLFLLQRRYPDAARAFDTLRRVGDPRDIAAWLAAEARAGH